MHVSVRVPMIHVHVSTPACIDCTLIAYFFVCSPKFLWKQLNFMFSKCVKFLWKQLKFYV